MTSQLSLAAAAVALTAVAVAAYLEATHARRRKLRYALQIRRLCASLPKVELHAHLHGCARLATIKELAPEGVDTSELKPSDERDGRSLDACFAIFGAIHKTVTTLAAVRRITREVLADFAADGVKYLELRTTPRALSDADVETYIRALLAELAAFDERQRADRVEWPLMVRLLLSVDRTGSAAQARQTVRLAAELRAELGYIVGVDFSGNPTRGAFADFGEAFEAARLDGLRVAVHVGELNHPADTASVLDFGPERLGHALVLSAADVSRLRAKPVPIELCPTSNLKTLQLLSLAGGRGELRRHAPGSAPCACSRVLRAPERRQRPLKSSLACPPLALTDHPAMAALFPSF